MQLYMGMSNISFLHIGAWPGRNSALYIILCGRKYSLIKGPGLFLLTSSHLTLKESKE